MTMINFNGVEISAEELVNLEYKRVKHCWPRTWTRIEIPIEDQWSAADDISNWIDHNIQGGKYGIIICEDQTYKSRKEFDKKHIAVLGFEFENDALMFKLLDGHIAYTDTDSINF
ncbi:MAG: hypothetical protein HC836_33165 [Richelia sp. RM2_1_2]|nr:hypothetical protein [Richelia sp. RM2_1_2]